MKQPESLVKLWSSLANQLGEVNCPFRAMQQVGVNTPTLAVHGHLAGLRPGLGLSLLNFEASKAVTLPMLAQKDLICLTTLLEGRGEIQADGQEAYGIHKEQWRLWNAESMTLSLEAGTHGPLMLLVLDKQLLKHVIAMADLTGLDALDCMISPKYRHASVLGGRISQSFEVLTQLLLQNSQSTSWESRLGLEARSLEWLREGLKLSRTLPAERHQDSCLCRQSDREAIEKVALYLEENLEASHSLKELSRIASLNEFKLKRGFREVYQTSVFAYLRDKRVERAEQILSLQGCSVIEAANAVGYTNPSHFSRAFRERYGVQPSAYRKLRRSQT